MARDLLAPNEPRIPEPSVRWREKLTQECKGGDGGEANGGGERVGRHVVFELPPPLVS